MAAKICHKCNGKGLTTDLESNISSCCDICKGHGVLWDIPEGKTTKSYNPDGFLGHIRL